MKRHCFHENNRIVIMVVSVILILVVTIANAAMFTQPISEYMSLALQNRSWTPLLEGHDLDIPATPHSYNGSALPIRLEAGRTYQISLR